MKDYIAKVRNIPYICKYTLQTKLNAMLNTIPGFIEVRLIAVPAEVILTWVNVSEILYFQKGTETSVRMMTNGSLGNGVWVKGTVEELTEAIREAQKRSVYHIGGH